MNNNTAFPSGRLKSTMRDSFTIDALLQRFSSPRMQATPSLHGPLWPWLPTVPCAEAPFRFNHVAPLSPMSVLFPSLPRVVSPNVSLFPFFTHPAMWPASMPCPPSMSEADREVDTVHQGSAAIKSTSVKKYKCDVCEKAFSRSNTLLTHKRIHTGEKPFKCDSCGRAFRQPGNLTRHRLTHTTVKPYACCQCGRAFNRASNLHTHMRTHCHFQSLACLQCGKAFHHKVDLKLHNYAHKANACAPPK